ncbi:DUF6223 family protein [Thermopolyspora sp. NPDC052614]|uniref:DUF6223 family protein n=1 Tax=Thermopolyspora sp. NPDC052614 TaxID=3155682 RepID=UPI00341C84A4
MPVRHLPAAASAVLRRAGSAVPAAVLVMVTPGPVSPATWTPGRVWAVAATLVGLAGVVAGAVALARSRRGAGAGKRGAVAAVGAGVAGAVVGGLVVAAAEGGPGTGYGIVGGYAALVVGVAGAVVGGLALTRVRRTG